MAGFSSSRVRFCFLVFSFGTGLVPIWAGQTCRVTSVLDGDTITALCDGVSTRIRLSSVDAPEKDQPYGDEATRVTEQLVLERDVTIDVVDVDRRAFDRLGPAVVELATAEGLTAHADSIRLRGR